MKDETCDVWRRLRAYIECLDRSAAELERHRAGAAEMFKDARRLLNKRQDRDRVPLREMASLLKLNVSHLSRIEAGRTYPSRELLGKLDGLLNPASAGRERGKERRPS